MLDRHEALRLYTNNAAWIAFHENERGGLSAGKMANIAVLDRPYLTMPASDIHRLRSVLTLLGGRVVHDELGSGQD
ncbi:hypothetical protein C6558_37615 [Ensifer sp. NM-2]|uniref:amidohydrolase family protein n=1 Tax=Ensifer TaxID=106591 RepID=UPI000D11BDFC|nr:MULTISPECIES: amidohydrolase family protein [Ensifer]NOV21754.1 hypothetical protein [Ensifer canadensis]PSS59559.1 hypothetical protein C6558_37615 [Ensifer sp. NM-2]